MTLFFDLPKQMFQFILSLNKSNNCAKSFLNLYINIEVFGPDESCRTDNVLLDKSRHDEKCKTRQTCDIFSIKYFSFLCLKSLFLPPIMYTCINFYLMFPNLFFFMFIEIHNCRTSWNPNSPIGEQSTPFPINPDLHSQTGCCCTSS